MIYLKRNGLVQNFTNTLWWRAFSDNRPITNVCQLLIKLPFVILCTFGTMLSFVIFFLGMGLVPFSFFIPELIYKDSISGALLGIGLAGWLILLFWLLYCAVIKFITVSNISNKFCPKVEFK